MDPLNVIKSYLVALGFQVDSATYNKAKRTLDSFENQIKSTASFASTNFPVAASAMVAAIASITVATAKLLDQAAQSDLGFQKFALRMYMSADAARSFKIVTDSMGESLHDIAWIPELTEHYQKLMAEAKQMESAIGGTDAKTQLRYLRDIRFEFTRLKVEAAYGMQHIAYYLFKYLGSPIASVKFSLKDINDWLQRRMPEWTSAVARFLAYLYNAGSSVVRLFGDFVDIMRRAYDSLPEIGKGLTILGGVIASVFLAGPVGRAILILSGLVLLIDDFYSYIDGRKSNPQLAPIWDKLLQVSYSIERHIVGAAYAAAELTENVGKHGFNGIFDPKRWQGSLGRLREAMRDWEKDNPAPVKGGEGNNVGRVPFTNLPGLGGIVGLESGGNPNAVHPVTGAFGISQIKPSNWSLWAMESGLGGGARPTRENQEFVTKFKWSQYLDKYKDTRLAAAAWFGGEGAADALMRGDMSPLKRVDANKLTIGDYITRTQGMPFSYPYTPNAPQGSQTNNVTINVQGNMTAEQEQRVMTIVNGVLDRKESHNTITMNRYPAYPGVTP